jgi:hypothetical protein
MGSATVGKTVRGTPGTWSEQPTQVSYQWQLCTAKRCTNIIGATKPWLKMRATYAGHSIRLAITAHVGGHTVRSLSKKITVHKT